MSVQIHDGMYDECATVSDVHTAWLQHRQAIPQWDDEGRTRARLATIARNRLDVIRGAS